MRKSRRDEAVAALKREIADDPAVIDSLLAELGGQGAARLKAANKLQLISQANPAVLYPHFQVFARLLESSSSVLLWNGIIILSYLATVDTERQFDAVLDRYYAHLRDGKLVTAANILGNSGRIAACRPDLAGRITAELLKVDGIPLPSAECREVARGSVLTAFAQYPHILKQDREALDFVVRCAASHRPAVKRQAEALLTRSRAPAAEAQPAERPQRASR